MLLVILAVVVVARMVIGPSPPEGLVVFVDLHPYTLRHEAFELGGQTEVAIRATGSFDEAALPTALAAQGWIVRRADRDVVWRIDPASAERGRGSAAHVRGDTLTLEAGLYDVYFAAYGQDEHQGRQRWRHDADQWQFVLRLLDESVPARAIPGQALEEIEASADNLVWTAAPLHRGQEREYLFEVKRATALEVYAVGEIDDEPEDYAWIEDAATGTPVWTFAKDNTEAAGGLARNRQFHGTIPLQPGAYRAVAKTNQQHAFGSWDGNPPFNPAAWGLSLYAEDEEAVVEFDPWASREPIIDFNRVPDSARRSQRFAVEQPIQVVVYAVGEMTDRHSLYDYGELLKEEPMRKETVWKMSWEASVRAGGDEKNRLEVTFLRLEPGIYTFEYKTDGSHAYDAWNAAPPDYPERWGATLFPMAVSLAPGTVRLLDSADEAPASAADGSTLPHEGDVIVAWTRAQGEMQESQVFELDREAKLHIVALGEISGNDQYDYGWIERGETGDRVWEMTWNNTEAAGGAERNRRFEGVVTLPAGRYVVHYVTDDSHHYESYSGDAPRNPEEWGLTIHFMADGR